LPGRSGDDRLSEQRRIRVRASRHHLAGDLKTGNPRQRQRVAPRADHDVPEGHSGQTNRNHQLAGARLRVVGRTDGKDVWLAEPIHHNSPHG
jgi:hypothetical protein